MFLGQDSQREGDINSVNIGAQLMRSEKAEFLLKPLPKEQQTSQTETAERISYSNWLNGPDHNQ